ncbi:MAG: FAD-dependent oxidoreductase [Pseudomonadota bacterium]
MTRIAIVGGGVAGLSAAAALSADGHDVLLFEAEDHTGYHASGRSAALFDETYGNAVVRALNAITGPALQRMGVLSPRGVLLVARAEDAAVFHENKFHIGATDMTLRDAQRLVPILSQDVTHVAMHAGPTDIDTNAVLQHFAREARRNGARIVTGACVTSVTPGHGLSVNATDVPAEIVVNAAGAWADEVAAMAGASPLGLQPYRRSMARLPAPGGHDVRKWPMLLGAGETWYAKPDAGGLIVSPAEEDPAPPSDAWADDMVLAEGMARYEAHVSVPVTRVDANWAGLRTFAPDRALVIGEDALSGFYWLAGQGGYGFQTCVAAADHLTAIVAGQPSPLGPRVTAALSPLRFS